MKYQLSNIIPEPRDNRDFLVSVPSGITPNLPLSVDLRQYAGSVENQLQTNSCVANSTISALELLLQKAGRFTDLSRLFNYYNIREDYISLRGIDGGAYLSDGFKSVAKSGVCTEQTWAFDPLKVNTKPSDTAFVEAELRKVTRYERVCNFFFKTPGDNSYSVDMIKATLAMGYPVTIAMVVNSTIFDVQGSLSSDACWYKTPISVYPNEKLNPSIGGHAMLVVGYNDNGFIIENSWGVGWGDRGYGIITYDVIKSDCFDAWTCTAFAGVEFEPEWGFLDVEPIQLSILQDVAPSYKQGDLFFNSGLLKATITGGTPNYQYKWTASDSSVVFVTQGEETKASVLVAGWYQGESRSITISCEVIDTSIPVQQKIKTSVQLKVTKAVVDRGPVYRLYKAVFNRLPDIGGLAFWEGHYNSGMTLSDIANEFIKSNEFQNTYGLTVNNTDFVCLLYKNVLGREPDSVGLAFWVENLATGRSTKVSVLVGFSESAENKLIA